MKMRALFAVLACLVAPVFAAAAPDAASLGPEALFSGTWFLSLGPESREELRFFAIALEDSGRLYLRRFATPSYYLDALAGDELKVLLWPEAKRRTLSFAEDGMSFLRETSPIALEYRRASPSRGASSSYEGDWMIGDPGMTLSIRACEKARWTIAMYFPGDPLSAIPMGYYPLRLASGGVYRSSSAFPDSGIEVEYDPQSDALLIRPTFKERPLAAELYESVRAWRGNIGRTQE
jgi:hypothetical protein